MNANKNEDVHESSENNKEEFKKEKKPEADLCVSSEGLKSRDQSLRIQWGLVVATLGLVLV